MPAKKTIDTQSVAAMDAIRATPLNTHPTRREGRYVLVWLQQTFRAHDNPAIDHAVALANELKLPVLVYHGLRSDYPHASDRLHIFILQARRSLESDLRARGIASASYLERPGHVERGLVYRLAEGAAHVFADEHFSFVAHAQLKRFAARTTAAVSAVDASRLVPTRALPSGISTTKEFRAAHTPLRTLCLTTPFDLDVEFKTPHMDLPFDSLSLANCSDDEIRTLVASCDIDHSVPEAEGYPGDRSAALERVSVALERIVGRYKWTRNNPALPESTARISPWMHFGVLGPREVTKAVLSSESVPSAARWKFFDELLTWREWSHCQAFQNPALDNWASAPARGRKTLEQHAGDTRPDLESLESLVYGTTQDRLWNAAQRQWLATGWMHNNLRMYWSKALISMTESPVRAWALTCYLNDRLSLDGRDPATYASMRWAFGEGKPAYREQDVYGWVLPKSSRALMNRDGVSTWVEEMNAICVPEIELPQWKTILDCYTSDDTQGE